MKKKKLKCLLQGLKNIRSKYYCEFSEEDLFVIDWAIKVIEKIMKPKKKWMKMVRKINNRFKF